MCFMLVRIIITKASPMKLKSPDLRIWSMYLEYAGPSYDTEISSFAAGNLEFFFFVLRKQKLEIRESPVSLS
jgi:hypothetical protein